jgi:hypothetical protein
MVALISSCWMASATSLIVAVRRRRDPDSWSTRLSLRNTLLLMLLVAIFISVKLSDSKRQHVVLARLPWSSKISCSGVKGYLFKMSQKVRMPQAASYMIETSVNEDALDDGGEAPNGGDNSVQLVRGAPVEASTRMA